MAFVLVWVLENYSTCWGGRQSYFQVGLFLCVHIITVTLF